MTTDKLPKGAMPTKERYLEIMGNLETIKPKTEFERDLIAEMKKIRAAGGVIEVPFD